jgi:hypothetical protein
MSYPDNMRAGRGRTTASLCCGECGEYDDVPGMDMSDGFYADDYQCPNCGGQSWE